VIPALLQSVKNQTPFDLCILDILLPDMSGYQVAKKIRALDSNISNIPLLALSSSNSKKAKKYREAGFDGFLAKPVQGQKLLRVLEGLLSKNNDVEVTEVRKVTEVTGVNEITETAEVTEETAKDAPASSSDLLKPVYILLVEDNPINQKLASRMLTKAGCRLDVAENGQEAVEKYLADPGKFDLILMDIQMPEMDGRDAATMIRRKGYYTIPIIAMTAESMKGDREKCLAAGMNDYISKPINRNIVFEMIRKWV
jgi:CheY-like chemotaxis protein